MLTVEIWLIKVLVLCGVIILLGAESDRIASFLSHRRIVFK
jgi:hypothetical protein